MNGIAQINGHKKLIFYDEFNKNTECTDQQSDSEGVVGTALSGLAIDYCGRWTGQGELEDPVV